MQGKYTCDEGVQLTKERSSDAGLDVYSNEEKTIYSFSRSAVSTGLKVAVPEGCVGLLWSRSGLSFHAGIQVGAGCIDSGYRGEVKVMLYNHSPKTVSVKKGDRIAQLLTIPVVLLPYEKVEELDITDRAEKGFGSSDKL